MKDDFYTLSNKFLCYGILLFALFLVGERVISGEWSDLYVALTRAFVACVYLWGGLRIFDEVLHKLPKKEDGRGDPKWLWAIIPAALLYVVVWMWGLAELLDNFNPAGWESFAERAAE